MSINQSHFELFGLAEQFDVDAADLDGAYRAVQGRVHPDRFAASDASSQRIALQWATRANEAYRTLRDPLARALYLCERRGIDVAVETSTRMDGGFLVQQMEWREALDDARSARDEPALRELARKVASRRAEDLSRIRALFAKNAETAEIAGAVRELMFIEKFSADVAESFEIMEKQ